jgi:hypothetical protein
VTVTVTFAATAPGANETLAEPSALVAVPPAVGVTSAEPGGDGPLPGIEAGSGGGGVIPVGSGAVLPDAEVVLVEESVLAVGGGCVPPEVVVVPATEPFWSDEPVVESVEPPVAGVEAVGSVGGGAVTVVSTPATVVPVASEPTVVVCVSGTVASTVAGSGEPTVAVVTVGVGAVGSGDDTELGSLEPTVVSCADWILRTLNMTGVDALTCAGSVASAGGCCVSLASEAGAGVDESVDGAGAGVAGSAVSGGTAPTSSSTTGTPANGSLLFAAGFVTALLECMSLTTGTVRRTSLRTCFVVAGASGRATRCACRSFGSGGCACSFGTRRIGNATAGTPISGSDFVGAT